jgi:DNA-binding transcriptional ArsR family regulator
MAYASVLSALGDGTRQRIVERLRRRPATVSELTAAAGVSQPAVSQHLAVLRRARVVRSRRDGRRQVYRLDPRGAEELRRYAERMWEEALGAFARSFDEERRR